MCVSTALYASKTEAGRMVPGRVESVVPRALGTAALGSASPSAGFCTSLSCGSWLLQSCLCSWFLCAWLIDYRVNFNSDFDKMLENVSIAQDWKWPRSLSCLYIWHVVLLRSSTNKVFVCFLKTRGFCKRKASITALEVSQEVYLWSVCFLNIKSPYALWSPAISKA